MVKQLAHNELIIGSSPIQRIMIDDRVVECDGLLNHCTQVPRVRIPLYPYIYLIYRLCGGMVYTLDLKSSASAYGFKSHHSQCPVAQLVERLSDKQEVIGSIPIRTNTRLA